MCLPNRPSFEGNFSLFSHLFPIYRQPIRKNPTQPFQYFPVFTNPFWILLVTMGKIQGLSKKTKNIMNQFPICCPSPAGCESEGRAQEGNSCLYCLELGLSGEAVQVAYRNKDYIAGAVCFWWESYHHSAKGRIWETMYPLKSKTTKRETLNKLCGTKHIIMVKQSVHARMLV